MKEQRAELALGNVKSDLNEENGADNEKLSFVNCQPEYIVSS